MKTLVELEREACIMPLHHDVNLQPVNAACEKCGEQLFIDTRIVLPLYPPKNMYICKACGNVETSYLMLPCEKTVPYADGDWLKKEVENLDDDDC